MKKIEGPFYGQFDSPVDKFLYERYFINKRTPGFFIECGAFDGLLENSCKFFEESKDWEGINVEPSPPVYAELLKNRPKSINLNYALSDNVGEATFTSVVHPNFGEQCTNGSIEHTPEHKSLLCEMGCEFIEYKVNTITYKDILKKYNIKKIDLFVLDVEGNELKVINSMKGCKPLPRIFCVEHGHHKKEEIIDAVESLGYIYDTESFVNSFFIKKDFHYFLKKIIDFIKK